MERTGKGTAVLGPKEFTTDDAAAKLGVTPAQLRRIAAVRGYEPSRVEEWHYGSRSGTRHFWSRQTIATIRRTREYAQTVERVVKRRQKLDEVLAKRAREEQERRQIEQALLAEVRLLSLDEHIRLALECLHAANRAAKHAAHAYERTMIYLAKDGFLSAMIRANRATVGTFEIQQSGRRQVCAHCGREWVGDDHCYSCDDDSGVSVAELRRWYLVDCGPGYRFHQPNLGADLGGRAVSIEPHDPTQEPRTIPSVRFGGAGPLDLHAQVMVVRSAGERLAAVLPPSGPTPISCQASSQPV